MIELFAALAATLPECPEDSICLIGNPIDVIVVTGRRGVSVTPATVDVIEPDLLREEAIPDLAGALSLVPGAQVVETGPLGAQASVFLRGADSDHTLVTLDGIRLNSPATPNGLYSVGSDLLPGNVALQVLRGPASATYGSDAVGGVIALTPRRSPYGMIDGSAGHAQLSVGELGTVQADASITDEVGKLTYDLALGYARTEGWDALPGRIVPEERRGERDGGEGVTGTVFLDYAASDVLTLSLTGLHRRADAEFDTFSGGPTGFQRADDDDLSSVDTLSVLRLGGTFDGGPWSLTANIGGVRGAFEETNGSLTTGDVRGERLFAEVIGRLDAGRVSASAGLLLEEETANIPVSFNDPLNVSEDHVGAFVFVQHEAGAVTLSGALRADDYDGFGTAVTWNAGALWAAEGGLRLRANAGTAFNAPTLSERFSTSLFNVGNPDLTEEEAFAVELGAGFEAGPITTELVLFRTDTDSLIEYDFANARNANVGDARAQGAELSVRYDDGAVSAYAAYTYTDAENQDTGAALLRRPEHGFTARAEWRATSKLSLSGRYVHTGARPDVLYDDQGFFGGVGETEGYGLAALTARYAVTDDLTVFGTATNLLDETYEAAGGFGGAPRRVRIGVRTDW